MKEEKRLVVAITGASGAIYAFRFLEAVVEHYDRIFLTVTENAVSIIKQELGITLPTGIKGAEAILGGYAEKIHVLAPDDLSAPPASGSVHYQGMVVIPCSMGTAGRIASGISNDLVTRVADVCLKEQRRLVLVIRETPLSLIHLRNLTALSEAGAIILPAAPAFYCRPKTVEDLVLFVVSRVMEQLGIRQTVIPEWEMVTE